MATTTSSLEEAISALRRRYGAAVVRCGDDPLPAAVWPTGLPALDELLAAGLPTDRTTTWKQARGTWPAAMTERGRGRAAPVSRRRTPPWEGTGGGPAAGSGTALGKDDEFLWWKKRTTE